MENVEQKEMNTPLTNNVADSDVEKKKPVSVTLEIENVEYTLEYNRAAVKRMESKGFSAAEVDTKILTSLDLMIEGAFYKNHPTLNQGRLVELRDYILDNYDAYELMAVLSEMLADVLPKIKSEKSDFKVFTVNRA